MKKFNLSDWAINHRSLMWYFMIVSVVAGLLSYVNLGREEDPNFVIKTMLVTAQWPGASTEETLSQITDRIEKKLQEIPSLDYTKSLTRPGSAIVMVNLQDTTKAKDVKPTWQLVRNMMADIASEFPSGTLGPFYNDEFGDVYGNVYAFTADGISFRQLRDYVEGVRTRFYTVPNTGKIELLGAQDEIIYLEFSTRKLAAMGITSDSVLATLQEQNAVVPSGVVQAGPERISLRVDGQFRDEKDFENVNLRIDGRFFRLSDIATVTRGYQDPPSDLFRYNGQPAIGLAVGMRVGANLLDFGEALDEELQKAIADLPVGVGVHQVADQPKVVEEAVGGFTKALFEAVAIVLAISFISLGLRAGFVVSLSIPLVLAMTFMFMEYLGISLQRISLGALIIALGLLVDDAMIAVEMMVARLERGDPLSKAATYVYTSTAFPMLTGTLVTIAGFIPVGLNNSAAGEFTFTLFVVIAVSLILSWIVAVLFAPLLGVTFLPKAMKAHHEKKGRFGSAFEGLLRLAMRFRWITIILTIGAFGLSIAGMALVQQQFFPPSDRPELIVDFTLQQNASIADTRDQVLRFEEYLKQEEDIDHWSSYIGQSAVRFILSYDVKMPQPNFGQVVIVTKGLEERVAVQAKLEKILRENFVGIDAYVKTLELGPPVGRPVQYRVSGPDVAKVLTYSREVASIVGQDENVTSVVYDWNEPGRVLKVDVLQDKARQLGISSMDIANQLNSIVGGTTVTSIPDSIYLVNVVARADPEERHSIKTIQQLQMPTSGNSSVPLAAIANVRYEMEQPVVWRRDRQPTVTVMAGITGNVQPATVVMRLEKEIKALEAKLPPDYFIATGGAVEESAKSQGPIAEVAPLMVFVMLTILMMQLQSFQRLFLVIAVAPLGLIGVVAALVPSGAPLGFVALLGVLALIGILIRNSVILVVQIEDLRKEGVEPWEAVFEATVHRMRPIMLTAAAASLAMIPISREIFWGPMAYAMMGGILAGTMITLLFLPALYIAWFRIPGPKKGKPVDTEAASA
ncbi:efflux RND transporter permease subunit [Roseibium suaedae]|uniref:Multidrug efflux pump subunit AcrB n=1 Tax=Roseibium suaedae TaxID=735517 RepID=A0A1M7BSE7_9HYPH|nr:efflux RND transporter permease subunit [Roseibium suaedae]SHL57874.1 Multidrug efflux pump subunit AcrB [Roseibium suaedae]